MLQKALLLSHWRLSDPRGSPRLSQQTVALALALDPVLTPTQRGGHHATAAAAEVALGRFVRVGGVLGVRPVERTPRGGT